MALSRDEEQELAGLQQYFAQQQQATQPQDAPSPWTRFAKQTANLPFNLAGSVAGGAQGLIRMATGIESGNTNTPYLPYNLPPPRGAGEIAADVVPGIAATVGASMLPGGFVSALGRAGGLASDAAAILGDVAAGGYLGGAQSGREAAQTGAEFGGLGIANHFLPPAVRVLANAAIPVGGQLLRGQNPLDQQSLINTGTNILLPALLGGYGRPREAQAAAAQPRFMARDTGEVHGPFEPYGPHATPDDLTPFFQAESRANEARNADFMGPAYGEEQARALFQRQILEQAGRDARNADFVGPAFPQEQLRSLLDNHPDAAPPAQQRRLFEPQPLPPESLEQPAPRPMLQPEAQPAPPEVPQSLFAPEPELQASPASPVAAALDGWTAQGGVNLSSFPHFRQWLDQALPGAQARQVWWDRNDRFSNRAGEGVQYLTDKAKASDPREAWIIDHDGQRTIVERPSSGSGINPGERAASIDGVEASLGQSAGETDSSHHAEVEAAVQDVARQYPGVDVSTVPTTGHLPPDLGGRIDPSAEYEGLNDPRTGRQYVVSGNVPDAARAREVAVHEIVGHHGVDKVLPPEEWSGIEQHVFERGGQEAQDIADTYFQKGLGEVARDPAARRRVAREYVARLAENTQLDPTLWQRIVAMVRTALRKAGIRREWSDGEVQDLIRRSHESLKSEAPARTFTAGNAHLAEPGLVRIGGVDDPAVTAFHGTPHRVEGDFTTDKMGTGEGAQVYGWGLYFAQSRDVADAYRRQFQNKINEGRSGWDEGPHGIVNRMIESGLTDKQIVTELQRRANASHVQNDQAFKAKMAEAERILPSIRRAHLYQVEFDAEPHEMLDYDKPLSEQSEPVKEGLRKLWVEMGGNPDVEMPWAAHSEARGENAYDALSVSLGKGKGENPKAASEALARVGIKGIRFRDQGSRGQNTRIGDALRRATEYRDSLGQAVESGQAHLRYEHEKAKQTVDQLQADRDALTHNFVVFDGKHIKITHEDGTPISADQAVGRGGQVDPSFAGKKATGYDDAEREGRVFANPFDYQERFEISDARAALKRPGAFATPITEPATVGSLRDVFSHPELLSAYPEMRSAQVVRDPSFPESRGGSYDPESHTISISAAISDPATLRRILIHETQHGIQYIEGHANGTSPDIERQMAPGITDQQAQRRYQNSAGEIEARVAEQRIDMTPEQLAATPPVFRDRAVFSDEPVNLRLFHPIEDGHVIHPDDPRLPANGEDVRFLRRGDTPASIDPSFRGRAEEAAQNQEEGRRSLFGQAARWAEANLGIGREPEVTRAQERGKGRQQLLAQQANEATHRFLSEAPEITPAHRQAASLFNQSPGEVEDVAALDAAGLPQSAREMLVAHKKVQKQGQQEIGAAETGAHRATIEATMGLYQRRAYQIFTDPARYQRRLGRGDFDRDITQAAQALAGRPEFAGVQQETIERSIRQYLSNKAQGKSFEPGGQSQRISQTLFAPRHDLTRPEWDFMGQLQHDTRLSSHDQMVVADAIRDRHLREASRDRLGQVADSGILSADESARLREIAAQDTVAPEVRAMFGEHTDPFEQTAYTTQKIVSNVRQARALTELAGTVLPDGRRLTYATAQDFQVALDAATPEQRRILTGYRQLPESDGYGVLAGHWADRGVGDALDAWNQGMDSGAQTFLGKLQKLMKVNATILNPATHAHNWMQAPLMMAIGRVYNPMQWIEASRLVLRNLPTDEAMRAELLRNNIIGAGMGPQELTSNARGVASLAEPGTIPERIATGKDRALRFMADMYSRPDDIVRTAVYLGRRRAGMSENEALDFTNRYTWNYGAVSPAVKAASNIPGLNPFISYSAELVRVMKNLGEDLTTGSGEDRVHAALNLGLMAAVPAALTLGSQMLNLSPDDQKEWEKLRALEPEYSRAQIKYVIGRRKDGTFNYFDLKPILPAGDPYTLARMLFHGDFAGAAAEQPVVGLAHNPLFQTAVDVSTGRNQTTGESLSTPGAVVARALQPMVPPITPFLGSQAQRIGRAITRNDQGGLGLENSRTGREDTPLTALLGTAGLRLNAEKPSALLRAAEADANEAQADAKRAMLQVLRTNASDSTKQAARDRYRDQAKEIQRELLRRVRPGS